MPTFHSLSPLRQSMSNPDMGEAASVVLSFHLETAPSASHSIEFPVEEQRGVIEARAENIGGANKNVDKFFTEELKQGRNSIQS